MVAAIPTVVAMSILIGGTEADIHKSLLPKPINIPGTSWLGLLMNEAKGWVAVEKEAGCRDIMFPRGLACLRRGNFLSIYLRNWNNTKELDRYIVKLLRGTIYFRHNNVQV